MRAFKDVELMPGALFLLAGMVLVLPLKWVAAILMAGAFHELCHIAAVRLCGGEVLSLQLGCHGAKMVTSPLTGWEEPLCALAGPLGALVLLPLARFFPRLALCAGLQSFYNLLPVYPLDGGRALRCASWHYLPPATAQRFCRLVETGCLTGLTALGLLGTFRLGLGLFPVLAAGALVIRVWRENNACNVAAAGVK